VDYLKAILLAVVEGITEFLPISSTGHLILVDEYLRLGGGSDFSGAFVVIIQLPAILSVVLYFWKDLWPFHNPHGAPETFRLWSKIFVAFLPAVVFGLLLDEFIEERLFNPVTVAAALAAGGLVLIILERIPHRTRIDSVYQITYRTALIIGLFQCVAMIPGTSRSAATIIGAMALGANRASAAEFSFFLAIPTMLGATTYTLMKYGLDFSAHEWALIAVGSVVSFAVAYAVIAFLMNFIRRHSFIPFGVYRIALAAVVVAVLMLTAG